MIDVFVDSQLSDFTRLNLESGKIQCRYRFVEWQPPAHDAPIQSEKGPALLGISREPLGGLFAVDKEAGVSISTWQSKGLCGYAGIERGAYYVLCAMLGLTQLRALQFNPILQVEDFLHDADVPCLFVQHQQLHQYAELLEEPVVCPGCRSFYHCLGADWEIMALSDVVESIALSQSHRSQQSRT